MTGKLTLLNSRQSTNRYDQTITIKRRTLPNISFNCSPLSHTLTRNVYLIFVNTLSFSMRLIFLCIQFGKFLYEYIKTCTLYSLVFKCTQRTRSSHSRGFSSQFYVRVYVKSQIALCSA